MKITVATNQLIASYRIPTANRTCCGRCVAIPSRMSFVCASKYSSNVRSQPAEELSWEQREGTGTGYLGSQNPSNDSFFLICTRSLRMRLALFTVASSTIKKWIGVSRAGEGRTGKLGTYSPGSQWECGTTITSSCGSVFTASASYFTFIHIFKKKFLSSKCKEDLRYSIILVG